MTRENLSDHLGHAELRGLLETLHEADDGNPRPDVGGRLLEDRAEAVRRYRHDQYVRGRDRLLD